MSGNHSRATRSSPAQPIRRAGRCQPDVSSGGRLAGCREYRLRAASAPTGPGLRVRSPAVFCHPADAIPYSSAGVADRAASVGFEPRPPTRTPMRQYAALPGMAGTEIKRGFRREPVIAELRLPDPCVRSLTGWRADNDDHKAAAPGGRRGDRNPKDTARTGERPARATTQTGCRLALSLRPAQTEAN
jgi:hypothetical protein